MPQTSHTDGVSDTRTIDAIDEAAVKELLKAHAHVKRLFHSLSDYDLQSEPQLRRSRDSWQLCDSIIELPPSPTSSWFSHQPTRDPDFLVGWLRTDKIMLEHLNGLAQRSSLLSPAAKADISKYIQQRDALMWSLPKKYGSVCHHMCQVGWRIDNQVRNVPV